MVNDANLFKRIIVNFVLVGLVAGMLTVGTQWTLNNFTKTNELVNARIDGPSIVKPDDLVTVKYDVVRYEDCQLDISRIFKRPDGREIQLQKLTMLITAKNPPETLKDQSYQVKIDAEVLNKDEQEVDGYLFPRSQRFCNWLDNFQRRIVDMAGVHLKVTR